MFRTTLLVLAAYVLLCFAQLVWAELTSGLDAILSQLGADCFNAYTNFYLSSNVIEPIPLTTMDMCQQKANSLTACNAFHSYLDTIRNNSTLKVRPFSSTDTSLDTVTSTFVIIHSTIDDCFHSFTTTCLCYRYVGTEFMLCIVPKQCDFV